MYATRDRLWYATDRNMPQNLDDDTRAVIVRVTSFTTLVITSFALYAQFIVIPRLNRRSSASSSWSKSHTQDGVLTYLLIGCLKTLALMATLSIALTMPIVIFGNPRDDSTLDAELPSSSINFCEEDFRDNAYIAEPANTASNLGCYVPLALLGLLGPPSKAWSGATAAPNESGGQNMATSRKCGRRFAIAYLTLLAIGFGSTALHALLTASAQGGDELPMLWYCASAAYCTLDIILAGYAKGENCSEQGTTIAPESSKRGWLQWAVFASAAIATAVYVLSRENFIFFYAMFSLYSQAIIFGILIIGFLIPWENALGGQEGADSFRANTLMPLAICTGWVTVLAMWTWVSEMLFCNSVTRDFDMGDTLAPWFWNRAVHPLWHFTSGILAWLLLQVLLAAHGVQCGWGEPQVRWFGAPYVLFESKHRLVQMPKKKTH